MNIKSNKIELEITSSEAWSIAFHIKHSLEMSIDSHYIQKNHDSYDRGLEGHAKPLFEEQCRKDMDIMNQLVACADGCTDNRLEKELWSYFEEHYNKKHTK